MFEWIAALAAGIVAIVDLKLIFKIMAILLIGALLLAILVGLLPPLVSAALSMAASAHTAMLAAWVEPIPTLVDKLSGGQWAALAGMIASVPALYAAFWIYRIMRWFL